MAQFHPCGTLGKLPVVLSVFLEAFKGVVMRLGFYDLVRGTLVAASLFVAFGEARADEPPAGFTALFNGKDLAGWRGGETFDHRKLLAMSAEERKEQIRKWTAGDQKNSMLEVSEATKKPHWY